MHSDCHCVYIVYKGGRNSNCVLHHIAQMLILLNSCASLIKSRQLTTEGRGRHVGTIRTRASVSQHCQIQGYPTVDCDCFVRCNTVCSGRSVPTFQRISLNLQVCSLSHAIYRGTYLLSFNKWQQTSASHATTKLKLNVVPVHAVKACGGVEVYLHAFLTSALDGGEWSAFLLGGIIDG
jgi:hypothetical protein